MEQDIRWKQRFSNYRKALGQLGKFIDKGNLNEFEEQGLIQRLNTRTNWLGMS